MYLFGGDSDNDNNIDCLITTSITDFGVSNHKRVPYIYADNDTPINIKPVSDGVGNYQYASSFGGARTKLSRGLSGELWSFEVTNIDGSAFKLGSIEAFAEVKSRKV